MISICILNWNCKDIIEQTIPLIINDLEGILPYEIIIYDQASSDGSVEYLQNIQTNNIHVIFDQKNSGNSIARNQMIRKAQYPYILLLDCDIIPIRNSIYSMINFMENNPNYAFIGYDCYSYSDNMENISNREYGISHNDILNWRNKVAFSQYGIFRKYILDNLPFPEFYPFDKPGWGAEDDILGHAIHNSGLGMGGCIRNRVYYHQKTSSQFHLGMDLFHRSHIERVIALFYFTEILSQSEQAYALKYSVLPSTHLKCNKYYWDIQNNLGDVATDYLLQNYFPFLSFDPKEKNNLLIFGGTTFNHIENANQKYNADFRNILYFGVGLSKQSEINHANTMIKNKNMSLCIVPRGAKSHEEFFRNGFSCERPCGDVLQLFAAMPKAQHDSLKTELLVHDIWHPDLIKPNSTEYISVRVADNNVFTEIPFFGLTQFLHLINQVSKVYSSQIHPIFISALLGKPCMLHQKDWRAEDLKWFTNFKLDMTPYDATKLRLDAQKNIVPFAMSFFKYIKAFK